MSLAYTYALFRSLNFSVLHKEPLGDDPRARCSPASPGKLDTAKADAIVSSDEKLTDVAGSACYDLGVRLCRYPVHFVVTAKSEFTSLGIF